jgi:hypothetical protein
LIFESEIALFLCSIMYREWTKTGIIRLVKKKDMLKKIKALIRYGKSYLIVTQALTIVCFYLITIKGYGIISPLFWFKVITSSILIYRTITYKKTTIYMYLNVGISEQFLIYTLLIFDFIIFMSLIIII